MKEYDEFGEYDEEEEQPVTERSSSFDPVDLCVGILVAIVIPLIVYGVIRSGVETKSDMGQFRQKIEVTVKPDAELIGMKISYFKKIYTETGREFLNRGQSSRGPQRLRERDWAKNCLTSLKAEITTLENELNGDAELQSRFAAEISDLASLKSSIEEDYRIADKL